jgi:hypothetical protein
MSKKINKKKNIGDWGLGIGDWGLGPMGQSPIPNPHNLNNFYLLF